MERNRETPEEALDWLLKEKEGQDIKIADAGKERKEREKSKKLFKKKIGEFGQKELFKEKSPKNMCVICKQNPGVYYTYQGYKCGMCHDRPRPG